MTIIIFNSLTLSYFSNGNLFSATLYKIMRMNFGTQKSVECTRRLFEGRRRAFRCILRRIRLRQIRPVTRAKFQLETAARAVSIVDSGAVTIRESCSAPQSAHIDTRYIEICWSIHTYQLHSVSNSKRFFYFCSLLQLLVHFQLDVKVTKT